MRDAFGGVFMMRLFLVFIVIFIGFGAISFNYAKAFRAKNKLIDLVETSQVRPENIGTFCDDYADKIDNILISVNYNNIECREAIIKNEDDADSIDKAEGCCRNGVVFTKLSSSGNTNDIYTQLYTVRTYNSWNLGIFSSFVALFGGNTREAYTINGAWEISGEAKVVVRK